MPYDYVRGELWHVLARIGSQNCLKKMMPMAKNEIKKEGSGVLLQWGVMAFLFACKKIGLKGQSNFFLKLDTFIQTLLIPVLPEDFYWDNGLVGKLLKNGKDFLPGIVLGSEMIKRKKELRHYRLKNKDLCQQVQNCFRELGIINRRQNAQIDQIGEIIEPLAKVMRG